MSGARTAGTGPAGRSRRRAWLALACVVLLVLTYQVVDFTYLSSHLPPRRYEVLAPGAPAVNKTAEFRLLSLRQTPRWGKEYEAAPSTAEPGAVWVVARLEVTVRARADYLSCGLSIVTTDGRSWEDTLPGRRAEGESCAPDPRDTQVGATYPFRLAYQLPEDEADHIAGLALDSFSWRPYQLIRPPG